MTKKNIAKIGKISKDLDKTIKNLDDDQRARFAQSIVGSIIGYMIDEAIDFNENDPETPDVIRKFINKHLINID